LYRTRKGAELKLSKQHIGILDHTLHRAANQQFCGDSPAMQELVEAGLMRSLGRKSFAPDEYFGITRAGRTALAITSTGATCSAAEDGDADRVSNNSD